MCPLYLLHKHQGNPLEHLVAAEGSDGHVQEQAVEDRYGDVGKRIRQQEHRQSDQDVRNKARQSRLPNPHNSVT